MLKFFIYFLLIKIFFIFSALLVVKYSFDYCFNRFKFAKPVCINSYFFIPRDFILYIRIIAN